MLKGDVQIRKLDKTSDSRTIMDDMEQRTFLNFRRVSEKIFHQAPKVLQIRLHLDGADAERRLLERHPASSAECEANQGVGCLLSM